MIKVVLGKKRKRGSFQQMVLGEPRKHLEKLVYVRILLCTLVTPTSSLLPSLLPSLNFAALLFKTFLALLLSLLLLTDFRIIVLSTPNTSTEVGLASALSFQKGGIPAPEPLWP